MGSILYMALFFAFEIIIAITMGIALSSIFSERKKSLTILSLFVPIWSAMVIFAVIYFWIFSAQISGTEPFILYLALAVISWGPILALLFNMFLFPIARIHK